MPQKAKSSTPAKMTQSVVLDDLEVDGCIGFVMDGA
jgi:hypothetical protein